MCWLSKCFDVRVIDCCYNLCMLLICSTSVVNADLFVRSTGFGAAIFIGSCLDVTFCLIISLIF